MDRGIHYLHTKKKFSDVKIGEPIYILDPNSQQVRPTTVIATKIHPKSKNRHVLILKFYALPNIEFQKITEGILEIAKIMVNRDDDFVILNSKIPTVCATKKQTILSWMNKSLKQNR